MSEEEFFNRLLNKIDKEFGYDVASTLKLMFMTKEKKIEQLENIRKEAIGYVTSYESISTIQNLDDIEKNKNLDEKTMNEMINRYLKVHDILLNILNKGSDKE